MSSIRRSEGYKQRDQDELLDSVEDRELETQAFLQEQGSGEVYRTIFQIAGMLHVSERKGREYFMKEWARDNVELSRNSRGKRWKWIGTDKKLERRFDVETMRHKLIPEEEDENATEYMKKRSKEKEELRQKLREKLSTRLMPNE